MADITVIMPTYERTAYLRAALESALTQTVPDLVVSIGDNSVTDAVEEVVAECDDPRIRYRRNRPAIGPFENWHRLGSQAETPVIASLHDDDVWEPTFLEEVALPLLADPTIAISFCDYTIIDGEGRFDLATTDLLSKMGHRDRLPAGRQGGGRDALLRLTAVWNAVQPAFAAAMRRSVLDMVEFPEDVRMCADLWLTSQLALREESFHYCPARLTRYRIHGGSLTQSGLSRLAAAEDALYGHLLGEVDPSSPIAPDLRGRWADLRMSRAGAYMRIEDGRAESQRELRHAAPDLAGRRRLEAEVLGRSRIAWGLTRAVRLRTRGQRPRAADIAAA